MRIVSSFDRQPAPVISLPLRLRTNKSVHRMELCRFE
jgi:hypothetical protein